MKNVTIVVSMKIMNNIIHHIKLGFIQEREEKNMETALNITMGIVILCTYISYVPQIIKIIRTKKAEDLSIASWALWSISGTSALIYSILLQRNEMIIETLSETVLIMITFILSITYNNRLKQKRNSEES